MDAFKNNNIVFLFPIKIIVQTAERTAVNEIRKNTSTYPSMNCVPARSAGEELARISASGAFPCWSG